MANTESVKVQIFRCADSCQPYPKNGNAHRGAVRFYWVVRVNGKYVGMSPKLSGAKEIAADYAQYGKPEIVRE